MEIIPIMTTLSRRFKTVGVGLGALVLLLGTGCEALDFANPNSPVIETATVQLLVTGAEADMRLELWIYLRDVAVIGREAYYFEPADPRYTGELLRNTIDPGGFLLTRPWAGRYNVVKNTVLLEDKAAELGLSVTDQAGVGGFAKTIRAYQLLMNLNLLNNNGLQLDFTGEVDPVTDKLTPLVSKAAAFTEIESLLDDGNTDLGNAGAAFSFKLSAGFAGFDTPATFAQFNRAVAARVAAYQGDWAGTLTALGGSFIDAAGSMDLGVFHIYSTSSNDLTNNIFETPTASFIKLMTHPTHETDAEAGDTRYSSKVLKRAASTTFDGLTTDLGVTLVATNVDPLTIIRNEELLLLRAEANIGLDNLSTAETDINVVRTAAGLGAVTTLTAGNAVDLVLHERRYSLFLEGHRWIDMRRYGKLADLPLDRAGDVMVTDFPVPEQEVSEN